MILDFDTQLQVSLRALEEVVAPALAGADKHVVEQLMLAMMTIGFVKTRLPDVRRFARMELQSWVELAREVADIAGSADELKEATSDGEQALLDPAIDTADIAAVSHRLRDQITALSAASVGEPHHARLDRVILEKNAALVLQHRLWCAPFGFELQPESLPAAAW